MTNQQQQAVEDYYNAITTLERVNVIDHHFGDVLSQDFTDLLNEFIPTIIEELTND